MLNVAPVSTKNLSFVNLPVRKIKRASAGKCMAVAVVCPGIAAEAVKAQRFFSLPARCKVLHTCRPLHSSNCDNCTHHSWGFEDFKNLGWKGGDFSNRHHWPSCSPTSPQQEPGSYCRDLWQLQQWGHGRGECPTRRPQL